MIKERTFAPLLPDSFQILSHKEKKAFLKKETILKKKIHYFDWTASGLAAKCIEKRIRKILPFYANPHSESSSHSKIIGEIYENARKNLKTFFGLDSSFALISCGFGSSAAIKKFQEIMGIYLPPQTKSNLNLENLDKSLLPLVIIGPYEHHSNELSFREGLCEVIRIPLDTQGLIDLEMLQHILSSNTHRKIIASFSLASNVSGIIAPFAEISHLVRKYGGIVCFDMASSSAYFDIPSHFYDVAFLSPHKLLGGIASSGILIIKRALINKTLPPTFCGGGVVGYVSRTSQLYFANEEIREEAGTPGILEFIRASLAYQLREEIGQEWIANSKKELIKILKEFLENESKITIYGNPNYNSNGTFSFNIQNKSPYEIANKLSKDFGILVRAGCSCAGPYGHDLLGLKDNTIFEQKPGWIRVSLHYTHQKKEIHYLCNSLKILCK